ncbi:MAG: GNAT superfamily N-acetyltransferase [Akkermansiaceae bacterium]|jgi:GNAT superfamily N-acetyltransferase
MSSTIYYFEMTSRQEFQAGAIPEGFELRRVNDPAINARLYREVGAEWRWTDRLVWSEGEWAKWVKRAEVETWVAFLKGEEAGYLELDCQQEGRMEIAYFGLLPAMIGKGLGGAMLTKAVEVAWRLQGTERVWLHTCTEDHPHAISNYKKRGFRLFRTEVV